MTQIKELLIKGCGELGLEILPSQLEQFEKYAQLLIDWNSKVNLTAIVEPEAIAVKHFIDSLAIMAKMPIVNGASIADVGTGAGFPGIPLRIMRSDLNILLLDSLQKRVRFLNYVINELCLHNITASHGRAEEAGHKREYREAYDITVSRAVSSLNTLAELCLPLIKVGGLFIALKGPQVEAELKQAKQAIGLLGGTIREVISYALPINGDQRTIVIIEKTAHTPARFPRRPGIPEKQPL